MFIRYRKIRILGHKDNEGILTTPGKILVTEKIDGANFGFYTENNILYFCSRNKNLTDSKQIEKTGILKRWLGIEPVLKSFQKNPDRFIPGYYYYGESLQKHKIQYDNIPGFVGFDVYIIDSEKFMSWEFAKLEFEHLNLDFINTYCEIDLDDNKSNDEYIDWFKTLYQTSAYKEGSAEGVVIKRYDTQQFAKIISDEFSEITNKKVSFDSPNEEKIVDQYGTDARIEKMVYKLHDEGHSIELGLMRYLYKAVILDILEEEISYIYSKYDSINFKTLNKLMSKKCLGVLLLIVTKLGKYDNKNIS